MPVDFTVRTLGDVRIVAPSMSLGSMNDVRSVAQDFMAAAGDYQKIVLDMSSIQKLPRQLLESFAQASLYAKQHMAVLVVAGPAEPVMGELQRNKFHTLVPVFFTVDHAVDRLVAIEKAPETFEQLRALNSVLIRDAQDSLPNGVRELLGLARKAPAATPSQA